MFNRANRADILEFMLLYNYYSVLRGLARLADIRRAVLRGLARLADNCRAVLGGLAKLADTLEQCCADSPDLSKLAKGHFREKCDSPQQIRASNARVSRIWREWPFLSYYSNFDRF